MQSMRHTVACLLASAFLAGLPVLVRAAPPFSLDLHAGHVDFYYDRYEITADDDVRIRLSDGIPRTGPRPRPPTRPSPAP